jgi:hypothetical protein
VGLSVTVQGAEATLPMQNPMHTAWMSSKLRWGAPDMQDACKR